MYCHRSSQSSVEAVRLAETLSCVPLAAGSSIVFQKIDATCSKVPVHKRKAAQLVYYCASLLDSIHDQAPLHIGMDTSDTLDEADVVLKGVHCHIRKWANCGRIKRFFKRAQIGRDLDKYKADVDHAMERLLFPSPAAVSRMQEQSTNMLPHHQAVITEALQELLISPRKVELAIQRHKSGGNDAYELMRVGQERLARLFDGAPAWFQTDDQQSDQASLSSESPSPVVAIRNQLLETLLNLHQLADIPPVIPILNNQIKMGWPHARGTNFNCVRVGCWLGDKMVTLKAIRLLRDYGPDVERLKMHLEHQVRVWSRLKHENVLNFFGIVTNMHAPICMISPWQLANVLNYRYDNPDVNPLRLLSQAAKGLEYLHDQQIVHGHVRCSNMLVSEEGVVSLSDFGLVQVVAKVVGITGMRYRPNSDVRWSAPEILNEVMIPTMASDVYSFGMSVLELLTMKHPCSHRKRDITALPDLGEGILPPRPEEPEAVPWISDALWDTMNRCWKWNPRERMLARELSSFMEQASELSER